MIVRRLGTLLATAILTGAASCGRAPPDAGSPPVVERGAPPQVEPGYEMGEPSYCEIALGPGAKARRWVVRSGPTLYVDLDGDGNLTEPGERQQGAADGQRMSFPAVELTAGAQRYTLTCWFEAGHPVLRLRDPRGRHWKAWGDEAGPLRFATLATQAPVIHFDGLLWMGIETQQAVVERERGVFRVCAGVGCHGRGAGSFAHLEYAAVPLDALPVARVTFLSAESGDPPVSVTADLDQRC